MHPFKITFSFICAALISFSIFGQRPVNRLDSILYISPDSEISNWNTVEFDDSDWNQGMGFIGYGDTFIMTDTTDTEIEPTQTVYTRSYFHIDTIDKYNAFNLWIDYDDGFVAYINGVEFARVNLGKVGSDVTFNQLADRSHECFNAAYALWDGNDFVGPVSSYHIDQAFIDSVFVVGDNVLSIEVHNDSVDGSDLMLIGALFNRTNAQYNFYSGIDRSIRSINLDSTHLPIIKINTNEMGIPSRRYEVEASIEVINGEGFNKPNDPATDFSGPIYIETRGQSSAHFPKKSYDIELQDADWNDTSVSLLGMPRESDWILQGPFPDKSLIRNALIYDLARKSEVWAPRIKFCEVIFNGEFIGLYNLTEKIKRDTNRVNIARLRPEEISGNDLTGGYILKYDKPNSSLQIVYPKDHNLQVEQENYIRNFIADYDELIESDMFMDPDYGYKHYLDENTLIDYMIIAEFGKNCDSYLNSTYFYKDRADKDNRLKVGPIWDFDLCFGNATWQNGDKIDQWQFANRQGPHNDKFAITRLLQDTELADLFEERWNYVRANYLSNDSMNIMIDSLVTYLKPAIDRNYRVWPVIDKQIFFPAYDITTYEEEITYIKNWIEDRTEWIDANIGEIFYPLDTEESYASKEYYSGSAYPNPFTDELALDLYLPEAGQLEVELLDIQGRTISIIANSAIDSGNYKVYWNKSSEEMSYGLYFVSIKVDGELYEHIKVLHVE